MKNGKSGIIMLFPHLPNPRMLKRINALKEDYLVEVIYWDRGTEFDKINQIPPTIKKNVIHRKANEGNPLRRIGTTIKVLMDALKIIRESKPQYLYISKLDMLMIGVIYKRFFNRTVEVIYEVSDLHSLVIDKQKKITKKFISEVLNSTEKLLCKSINLLVVTSEYFYKHYYSDFVNENKLLFIPNTPDSQVFNDFSRRQNQKFTIGFIGAVRYAKQIEMLIEAAEISDVNVFIAGKGVDYNRIKEYAKGKSYVEMYGEYEYEKEIKFLYEKVNCIYSVYDASKKNVQIALPNRLYEAIYTSTPIIAAKNTYLGEIVETHKIGETVNYNEIHDLVNVINRLKNDENIINCIEGEASHLKEKWVLKNFNKKLLDAIRT
ncbi:glycosyltransferase [Pseudalkalibacillus decolorationis]|uniref:glycosyltransferase n=1 Tax=Pseudalkalibacillus decolorationis TaxID=163879 RepID=UPI00214900E6|nr:glycosyltransferase [Pseudalkalibacillus decolorationis]